MPTGRKERPPWRNRERKPARNWPPRLRTERRKSGSLKTGKRCCRKLYALSTAVGVFCHKQRLFLWTPFEQNEPPDAQKGFICITIRVICQIKNHTLAVWFLICLKRFEFKIQPAAGRLASSPQTGRTSRFAAGKYEIESLQVRRFSAAPTDVDFYGRMYRGRCAGLSRSVFASQLHFGYDEPVSSAASLE